MLSPRWLRGQLHSKPLAWAGSERRAHRLLRASPQLCPGQLCWEGASSGWAPALQVGPRWAQAEPGSQGQFGKGAGRS